MVEENSQIGTPPSSSTILEQKKKNSSLTLRVLVKVYRLLFTKWHHKKKIEDPKTETKLKIVDEEEHKGGEENPKEESMQGVHSFRYNIDGIGGDTPTFTAGFCKPPNGDTSFISSPFSRSASRRSPSPTPSSLYRSVSRKSTDSNCFPAPSPASLSRNTSRRSTTTPIMFSNSTGIMKPPAIEKNLECTLEELCFGCKKKFKITRDAFTNSGQLTQEEEMLTIKVKPGWRKGTKITFEGKGNEVKGSQTADITFVIAEKRHPFFRREGDDLELVVEIPLVKALTGCTISVPLLGREKMDLSINDEIIHPGYQMIIEGQGMPTKDQGRRGNLKLIFLVDFPTKLTHEQKSNACSILENCC